MITLPRVELPAEFKVDPTVREVLEKAEAHARHLQKEREGMVAAMIRTGYRPFMGKRRRTPRPTKAQRYAATMRTRSAYLRERSAS